MAAPAHEHDVGLRPAGTVGKDGRVLVRRDPSATTTRNGIAIPVICQQKETTGTVIAVHRGVQHAGGHVRPCCVQPGDRVLMHKYAGTDISWRGETLTVVREDDLYAVLEDGA